ncbi:MAG: hypothetical protein JST08_05360 [Actinobacteria bacterium]|nr:hypothetical protein [Actinomycetota bacterium]
MILLCARILLAAVFAVAGASKLQRRAETEDTLGAFGVPARARAGGALSLPMVELAIATALVPVPSARWAALVALLLLVAFSLAVARVLLRGEQVDCNCFGALRSAPVGPWTLVRNVALAAVAGAIVVGGPGRSLGALDGGTVLAVAAAAAGVLLLALTWFTWELFKQNGRLLARVRVLEEGRSGSVAAMPHIPGPPEAIGGLPEGEQAPDLVLATLDGAERSILGLVHTAPAPLALVFSDPACSGCRTLIERLPAMRDDLDGVVEPVLVTRGGGAMAEAAGAAGLTVLVQEDREGLVAFKVGAVPAAVLLDAEGRVAGPTAIGDLAVDELLLGARPASATVEVVQVAGGVG